MKMAQAMESGGVRLRFSIRSLMIAVAVIAGLLALLTAWTEFLPVLIVVGIPMVGSAGLLACVPPHRPRWRFLILTQMLGWIILGCGWLWRVRPSGSSSNRRDPSDSKGPLARRTMRSGAWDSR